MMKKNKEYIVYKGLQAPLVFKGFKGKFIYRGLAIIFLAFIVSGITTAIANFYLGIIALGGGLFGGFFMLATQQKKGLYSKNKDTGIFISPNNFKLRRNEKESV